MANEVQMANEISLENITPDTSALTNPNDIAKKIYEDNIICDNLHYG